MQNIIRRWFQRMSRWSQSGSKIPQRHEESKGEHPVDIRNPEKGQCEQRFWGGNMPGWFTEQERQCETEWYKRKMLVRNDVRAWKGCLHKALVGNYHMGTVLPQFGRKGFETWRLYMTSVSEKNIYLTELFWKDQLSCERGF